MGLWRRFAHSHVLLSVVVTLAVRLSTLALLSGGLYLGLTNHVFPIPAVVLINLDIDPETSLLLLGVINKIADYLVEFALDDIAERCLSYWMLQADPGTNRAAGIYLDDFDMKDELTRPWLAIGAFLTRWRHERWLGGTAKSWRDWTRLLLSLAVSICFLLLGAGINTIGLPKGRWYPSEYTINRSQLPRIETQHVVIMEIEYGNYWGLAGRQIGTVPETANTSLSLMAQDAFRGLDGLFDVFAPDQSPRGFASVAQYGHSTGFDSSYDVPSVTAINSTLVVEGNNAAINSTSTWGSSLWDVYAELRQDGPDFAQTSIGIIGQTYTVRPMLTTVCSTGLSLNPESHTIIVEYPNNTLQTSNNRSSTTAAAILIQVPEIVDLQFGGITCSLSLRQIIYPCDWGMRQDQGWWWGGDRGFVDNEQDLIMLPSQPSDSNIVSVLGGSLRDMLPWLDSLSSGHSFARHALLTARHLQERNGRQNLTSDVAAITAVIGTLAQNLLTMGSWHAAQDNSSTDAATVQQDVRFYVYGSGPRVGWQWTATIILVVLALAVLVDILWVVIDPQPPPDALEPAGMMLVANASKRMKSTERRRPGQVGAVDVRYYLFEPSKGEKEVTDDQDKIKGARRRMWWQKKKPGRKVGRSTRPAGRTP